MVDVVSYDDEAIVLDQYQEGIVQRQQTHEINNFPAWTFVTTYSTETLEPPHRSVLLDIAASSPDFEQLA